MEDFFDRLDRYMEYRELNDNKLTVLAGLSIGSLGKQRKGSRGLSNDSIAKILISCSDLSADWLITGRGDMLKKNNYVGQADSLDAVNEDLDVYKRCQLCKEKDKLIATQAEYIELLKKNLKD